MSNKTAEEAETYIPENGTQNLEGLAKQQNQQIIRIGQSHLSFLKKERADMNETIAKENKHTENTF